ncbi:hypothetical protein [Stenotrophomonas nematodicola]|uniref:hypothetical protein n=1 Tax=Stenotrophomonas nematodicola TaxID=2656746 RepID=UPI0037358997
MAFSVMGSSRSGGVLCGVCHETKGELHNVGGLRLLRLARASRRAVDAAPFGQGGIRLGVLAGHPAFALDQVSAAAVDAAKVVDVARAVSGGAGRQPFGWLMCR